jgi:hypothetical protein
MQLAERLQNKAMNMIVISTKKSSIEILQEKKSTKQSEVPFHEKMNVFTPYSIT